VEHGSFLTHRGPLGTIGKLTGGRLLSLRLSKIYQPPAHTGQTAHQSKATNLGLMQLTGAICRKLSRTRAQWLKVSSTSTGRSRKMQLQNRRIMGEKRSNSFRMDILAANSIKMTILALSASSISIEKKILRKAHPHGRGYPPGSRSSIPSPAGNPSEANQKMWM
jgi:hypothetical protein